MKLSNRIISTACLLLFMSCFSQKEKQERKDLYDIVFMTGCEYTRIYQTKIYTVGDEVFAEKIAPIYFYGNSYDSIWTTKLDTQRIAKLDRFIAIANTLNGVDCNIKSTSVDYYKISGPDSLNIAISGHCEWFGIEYPDLEQALFKEQFRNLQEKKERLIQSISKQLNNKWVVEGLTDTMHRGAKLILYPYDEIDDYDKEAIFWTMSDSLFFNSSKNKVFDLSKSYYYDLIVQNGETLFRIGLGVDTLARGGISIHNYGADLIIDSFANNKVYMTYEWR